MSKMQSIEEILTVLTKADTDPERCAKQGDHMFERVIRFEVCDVSYWIEWWANRSYLSIGSRYANYIPFIQVSGDTFWPSYRTGLRFRMEDGEEFFVATTLLDWQDIQQPVELSEVAP